MSLPATIWIVLDSSENALSRSELKTGHIGELRSLRFSIEYVGFRIVRGRSGKLVLMYAATRRFDSKLADQTEK